MSRKISVAVALTALWLAACSGGRRFIPGGTGGGAGTQMGTGGGAAGQAGTIGSGGAAGMGMAGAGGAPGTGGAVGGTGGGPACAPSQCAGFGTPCGGTCSAAGACVYPSGSCGSGPTCGGTKLVGQGTCSDGACVVPAATSCAGGFICSANACQTACTADSECQTGYFCEANACHVAATQVTVGNGFACALLADGSVRCWGLNWYGALGPGGPADGKSDTPIAITGLGGPAKSIAASSASHACALLTSGSIKCWGSDWDGELGSSTAPSVAYVTTPLSVDGLPGPASLISTQPGESSCAAMAADGSVYCWGDDIGGELGNGTTGGYSSTPVQVPGLTGVTALGGGPEFVLAIMSGYVYGWGNDGDYQLGNGSARGNGLVTTPGTVSGIGGSSTGLTVAGAGYHACAIIAGGQVLCWGWNTWGEVGPAVVYGDHAMTAVSVDGLPSGAKGIAAGLYHSCAVLTNGAVWCWGQVTSGQLGNGVTMMPNGDTWTVTPVQVTGLPAGLQATAIAAGANTTCALLSNGSVWCWGQGDAGQLGNGYSNASSPLEVSGW